MNESGDDAVDDSETLSTQSDEINNDDISCTSTTNPKPSHQISCSFSAFSFDPNETCETFITQHLNLQVCLLLFHKNLKNNILTTYFI